MAPVRVIIGTGGTAGHVFPAIATAERLRDAHGAEVTFVGRAGSLEARLVEAAGFPMRLVEALPFARKLSLTTLRAPFAALRASSRSRAFVRDAAVVLGMGGYVSVPISLAARRERIPLVVHEQNAKLGLANRVAARWAAAVALSFGDAADRLPRRVRREMTGNPVRARIVEVLRHRESLRREAREVLGLEEGRRTIVVMGGSQGALRLNRAAVEMAGTLGDRDDLQLLVLTGPAHHAEISTALSRDGRLVTRTEPFLDRMELAYAVADLLIGRAGATTVAEVSVSGVPALLVPYPFATGKHQDANARALHRAGAATVLGDEECTGAALTERVEALIDHPERLVAMADASRRFGRPEAADALAELTLGSADRTR